MKNRIESFQGSTHFRLHYVADSVIAAIAVPGSGAVGNASIIDLGDIAMVVDTFATIQAAEDLKAAAEYITGKPVSYVINTHWHSDHTSGNKVFSPVSPIISTAVTREVMDTFARERLARKIRSNCFRLSTSLKKIYKKKAMKS
jgi:glyoxylase-like metal-dependent hydrolase (beta-lactamase superfamily II)